MKESTVKILQAENNDQPKAVLKLSRDHTFLVGYVDIDNKEQFYVYNIMKNEMIWQGVLDLAAESIREDPNKLLLISDDCLNLYARSPNSKGIVMHSLFDGSEVISNLTMHTNYIF